jgi:4-amino-4-deoxy-L-arabinose transferase-like glycosyltransferase
VEIVVIDWIKSNRFIYPVLLALIVIIPHFPFLTNGYVDVEPYSVRAAAAIAQHGLSANLSEFYKMCVSPIGSLLPLSLSYKIFGVSVLVSRMTIFIISLLFVLWSYFYLSSKIDKHVAFLTMCIVAANPMFIVYSQVVNSDATFTALASIAMLLFLFGSSNRNLIISSITLGFSLATKYVAAFLFPVILLISAIRLKNWKRFLSTNAWYFVLCAVIGLPLVAIVFHFQSRLVAEAYTSDVAWQPNLLIPRFFSYALWLGLFVGVSGILFIFDLWRNAGTLRFIIVLLACAVVTFAVSRFFPISSLHVQSIQYGEANLGWVESKFPPMLLSLFFYGVIIVAELFVISLIWRLKQRYTELEANLFWWIIVPFVLLSLIRVANRYLMMMFVPIALYTVLVFKELYSKYKSRWFTGVLALHILLFFAVGFYSNYYLHNRGLTG